MNAVSSIWRQLVRRRLWPVAVLLLAALAAVPVVLAREPEAVTPVDPVPVVSTTKADDSIAEPVVAKVEPEDRSRRRRVLGAPKDPFGRRAAPPGGGGGAAARQDEDTGKDFAPEPSKAGGSTGGSVPVDTEPAKPEKTYKAGSIVVRMGVAESDTRERFVIEKLGPVPNDEAPLLVYLGLSKNGKKAKFLIDAAIEVDGDGDCKPHPASCETLELAVGETEFLDVIDPEAAEDATDEERILETFQLDLVDIKRAGDDDVK